MDSIGATALKEPINDNTFIADLSPVLSQKPMFFAIEPLDKIIEDWDYKDCETKDEFKQKVKLRKLQGFIGNEYTPEEAMSKQFGPQQIEARAFLEHYWEMKAKCLDAVEKKRNSEVEAFQRHPLFSPDWLVPTKRDIRWYLKNEIGSDENEMVKERKLSDAEPLTQIKLRKQVVRENSTSFNHKRFEATRKLGCLKRKATERKRGTPDKEVRKQMVTENSSFISYKRFPATRDLGSSQHNPIVSKKGMPVKGIRERIDEKLS